MTARCAQYVSALKIVGLHYTRTDGRTPWRHRAVKIRIQIIADIIGMIGITDILSQRYRYIAHHYSLAIRQAFDATVSVCLSVCNA